MNVDDGHLENERDVQVSDSTNNPDEEQYALDSQQEDGDNDNNNNNGDEPLRMFNELIDFVFNFASLPLAGQLEALPDLVEQVKGLFLLMFRETKKCKEAGDQFKELVRSFVKLVRRTCHNMNMFRPHLAQARAQMELMREALMPDSPQQALSADDTTDIQSALSNMLFDAEQMLKLASTSSERSEHLRRSLAAVWAAVLAPAASAAAHSSPYRARRSAVRALWSWAALPFRPSECSSRPWCSAASRSAASSRSSSSCGRTTSRRRSSTSSAYWTAWASSTRPTCRS